eukprot:XP_011662109.1 PREDICTED: putative nuclease HARBI1 [Strongylocentrotus purpuratus]
MLLNLMKCLGNDGVIIRIDGWASVIGFRETVGNTLKMVKADDNDEIDDVVRQAYIQFPTTPLQIQQTQQRFFDYCQFPGVVGAIDCTHVHIRSPGGDNAQRFLNRKGRFSINVQAVCTHEGLITDVVARWPGGSHDSQIFRESWLKRILQEASHEAKWLLGDSGYACQPYVMTPLLHPRDRSQQRYNRAQIRGRNIIERTFGMMKRRFPCLNQLGLKLETTLTTIVAVVVLWNLSIMRNEPQVNGPEPQENPGDLLPPDGANNIAGQLRRQWLIEHHFT